MTEQTPLGDFLGRVSRGRAFERWERSQWSGEPGEEVRFEAPTQWKGKPGRVDIRLVDTKAGYSVVVEIKATDWDAMKPHRVRPNALRHARQIWRYIKAALQDRDVVPALVYPPPPKTPGRKEQVEAILYEQSIQAVWREELED